jgi:hypothetical protein
MQLLVRVVFSFYGHHFPYIGLFTGLRLLGSLAFVAATKSSAS